MASESMAGWSREGRGKLEVATCAQDGRYGIQVRVLEGSGARTWTGEEEVKE